ncbi:MAG: hydrolase 2, exosortase A system-associated [Gammaproteobacteria bacterium]|nr:MAG: hydrolase 2, exosortase A system-associated [Gammaproteobacteria bacterium]
MPGPNQVTGRADILPLFLPSRGQRIFALAARPFATPSRVGVLVCPAFGEEMNRTRRTMRLLAGAAASQGACAIYPDLHGTGDSPGDFADARWDAWLDDLRAAADWLRQQDCTSLVLVGIRAGALLAWDLLRGGLGQVQRLVLWQPVLTGKAVVTDLLRTRIAANLQPGTRDSVAQLRGQLAAGQAVEAVGYMLAPDLVNALDATALAPPTPPGWPPLSWIEVTGDEAGAMRPAAVSLVAALQTAGSRAELLQQRDPPFWSTAEITVGHGIVQRTLPLLAACP